MARRMVSAAVAVALATGGTTFGSSPAAARRAPERIAASSLTPVAPGMPAGASAALVNLSMTDGTADGYVTAGRCSVMVHGAQGQSSGNHPPVATASNLAVSRLDGDGRFCVANQVPVNLVIDAQGWFAPPAPGGLSLVPSPPRRALDTRTAAGSLLGIGWVTPVHTGAAAGTRAALVNIATVGAARDGYVTADKCSRLVPGPQPIATASYRPGAAASNLAVVPVDDDGRFCIFNLTPVHVVVDVHGELREDAPSGHGFVPSDPARIADTRAASPSPRPPGTITRVVTDLPQGSRTALVNIAMTDAASAGYVTAAPCSTMSAGPQPVASGNHPAAASVSNLAAVALDPDGSFCVYASASVHVVVDVQGWFGEAATERFFVAAPARVLDTRPPGGEPPGNEPPGYAPQPPAGGLRATSCRSVVHIGDSTSVGMISSSLIPDASQRLPAQYQWVGVGDPRMEISGARSILETLRGQENARDVARRLKASGYEGCWVFALGTTDTANLAKEPRGVSRRDRIDLMMSIVGDDPVLWVNTKTIVGSGYWSDPWMQVWNAELRAATPRHPNLTIYDWASVVQRSWFSGDGIHYTADGYRLRAQLIADALAVAYPA